MRYKYSSLLKNFTDTQLLALTDKELLDIKEECQKVDDENKLAYKEASEKSVQLIKELTDLFSDQTNVVKYLKKLHIHFCYVNNISSYGSLIKKRDDLRGKIMKEEQARNADTQTQLLLQRAIVYLQGKGKVLGVDFTLNDALSIANEIRFEELKAEAIVNGGVDEFDGMNCDDCSGWDGVSHRCDCGNRRMDWEFDGNFENMWIYGSAY